MVEWKTIEEAFELRNGYTPSKNNPEYWEGGTIPWFRMEDIRQNGHVLSDSIQHITPISVKKSGLFPANSIIMATTATIGEHALVIVDSQANQQFTGLITRKSLIKSVLPRFAFYYCFLLGEWCKQHIHQGGFASVDMEGFKKYPFPVPPLAEQERIVGILDTFTASIDNLKEQIAQRRKQFDFYRDQLLDLEGKPGVQMKTIQDVCKRICSGGTPSTAHKEYYEGNIPWLRTQEIDWHEINDTEIKITEDAITHSSAKLIPSHCVIVAMYGATAAKVAINKIPLSTNQACCNLEIDASKALYKYVYHWLCKEYLKLKAMGEGSQNNINGQKVKGYPIPLPPLSEQERIVSILDTFEASIANLEAQLEQRQKQYEYYRNKLLTFE